MKPFASFQCLRVGLLVGCLVPAASCWAELDAFVNFGSTVAGGLTVTGTSSDPAYPADQGWIRVSAIAEGQLNRIVLGSASTGSSIGKAQFTPLTIQKTVDAASPKLFSALARGLHFDGVRLVWRRATGTFYTAVLKTAFVTAIDWTGNPDDDPGEKVVLNYGAVQWAYTRFSTTGKPSSPQPVNWDAVQNTGSLGLLAGLDPTATSPTFTRSPGLSLKIKVADIASDPSTIPLTVSLGTSADGATLSTDNTYIYYLPASDQADAFSYTVENGLGGRATGTINVRVLPPGGLAQNITSAGGTVTLNFAGIPGFVYDVQYASDLSGNWTTVTTVTAPSDGLFTFTEPNRSNPAFYRLLQH
jgi:type VI secretion system Hcp family effector